VGDLWWVVSGQNNTTTGRREIDMNKTLKKGLIIAAISLALLIVAGWLAMLWGMRTYYEDISHKLSTLPGTEYIITQPQSILWVPGDGHDVGYNFLASEEKIEEMTNSQGVIIDIGSPVSRQIDLPVGTRLKITAMRIKYVFANGPYYHVRVSVLTKGQEKTAWLFMSEFFDDYSTDNPVPLSFLELAP
jgi:hypothetical protein